MRLALRTLQRFGRKREPRAVLCRQGRKWVNQSLLQKEVTENKSQEELITKFPQISCGSRTAKKFKHEHTIFRLIKYSTSDLL
jgi:hypothetical protein